MKLKYNKVLEFDGKCGNCPFMTIETEIEYDYPGCDCCEPSSWENTREICYLLGYEPEMYDYVKDENDEWVTIYYDRFPHCPLEEEKE